MTIEAGPKPTGVRPAAADTRNQKNKSAASDGQGGGFGAILASMDSSENVDQSIADVVDASTSVEAVDVPTTTENSLVDSSVNGLTASDTLFARESVKGLDAQLLAEPAVLTKIGEGKELLPKDPLDASAPGTAPVVDAALPPPLDAVALVSQASQWSSLSIKNGQSDGKFSVASTVQLDSVGVKSVYAVTKPEGISAGPLTLNEALEIPGKPDKLQANIPATQAPMDEALQAKAHPLGELESRSHHLVVKSVDQTSVPIAMALAATSSTMPARREDQTRERSVFRSNAIEATTFGQTFLTTSASAAVQYTPDAKMSPDLYVAEKVAYWISNDVQNAEMKLNGIGLDPVEVSIRMHGNEAHVAFRTDELQARAALENASTHLKELLMREGLVLTGVSVGTAGAGDSGDREGKSRQGGRQAGIAALTPSLADSGILAGRVAGGTLDLFV